MTKLHLHLFVFLLMASSVNGQSTFLNGIVNHYTSVTAFDSCTGILTVSDTTGFRVQGHILIAHGKGATINTSNTAAYGTVTDMRQTGRIEVAEITGRTGNSLTLKHRLMYPILPDEKVQAVTYPEYANVVVNDTLKPLPWNGSKGGIIALKVTGTLTLNAPILANGTGLKGGASYLAADNNCTWIIGESAYSYSAGNWRGANKGEGIAVTPTGQELGRGPIANGGGGANDHNAGGGGGANMSAGGLGGNNNEPSTFGCDGFFPGLGGRAIATVSERLFLGGGGGAGHGNNTLTCDGGNGGGIIIIEAGNINGTLPEIAADGTNGVNSAGDGGGGAGAGGTIWVKANTVTPNLLLHASGGRGGDASGTNLNRCFGPGGGGAGGRILTNITGITPSVAAGSAGLVFASTNGCNGTSNGATNGQAGQIQPIFELPKGNIPTTPPTIIATSTDQMVCIGNNALFTALSAPTTFPLQWQQNSGAGWTNIPGENAAELALSNVQSAQNMQQFRLLIDGGACFSITTPPATLTVLPNPEVDFSGEWIGGSSWIFNSSSLFTNGQQLWDFGDNTTTDIVDPVHTFPDNGIYEVELTVWNNCDTVSIVREVSIIMPPIAQFTVPTSVESCNQAQIQVENTSTGVQFYQWFFPGGNPLSSNDTAPLVTYTASGSYPVVLIASNATASDTLTQTVAVNILTFPVANWSYTDLPNGSSVAFNFTGSNAVLYSWDFGDGSPLSTEANPVHVFPPGNGTYQVRLQIINACGASVLEQVVTVHDELVDAVETATIREITLHPNPASTGVWVVCPAVPDQIIVYNALGLEIKRIIAPGQTTVFLPVVDWPSGGYRVAVYLPGAVIYKGMVVNR